MVSSRMFVTKQFGYEQRRDSKRTMRDCRSIAFMVHNLDKKINRRLVAYGAALGIDDVTIMNGWIIGYLYDHQDQDTYQRDIEAEFSIARSTATGILKLMEKKGYIRRVSVERDARLKKLELTALGVNMEEGTIRNINQMETLLRQGISDEELEVFFRVIRKMRSNIEIQQGETNRRRE